MRIFDLALKDLLQIFRDKKSALFLLLMPLVFTFFMGFAFKSAGNNADPRLPLGWLNHDSQGQLSLELQHILEASSAVRVVEENDEIKAAEQVRKGDLVGLLEIPLGFSQQTLAGTQVQLPLVVIETSSGGQSARQAVESAVTRLLSSAEAANLSIQAVEAVQPFTNSQARQNALNNLISQATQAWQNTGLSVELQKYAATPKQPGVMDNPYNQSSPGMIVMFAIFGLTTSAMLLVLERRTRTLQRLLTTSMTRAQIIAGHLLAMFVVVLLQELLLVIFGQVAFGVNYLRQPLGSLLVMVALGLWVASLGLLIGVLSKGEEQVILFSMVAMFVFTALAGAWFPLDGTGSAFSLIGHLTPGAWAMVGFQNIIVRGLGMASLLLPVGILLAYALGFFGLAVWQFKQE
jgi:ABC-2 type transport system permease protein